MKEVMKDTVIGLLIAFWFLLFLDGLTGCGHNFQGPPGPQGNAGQDCILIKGPPTAVECNGVYTVLQTGTPGPQGVPGVNGHSAVFAQSPSTTCVGTVLMVATDKNDNGILDSTDTGIQSVTICNGQDGAQGAAGLDAPPTPFTPVGLVNPCNDTGQGHEVFFQLADGTLIASFSDNAAGDNTRFSTLFPGNFVTTDGYSCYFTIDATGNITNQHH